MGLNLYQINEKIEELSEKMVDADGVINEDVMEQIEELKMDFDTKMENIGILIKSLRAEVEALKAEKDGLDTRIKVRVNKIDGLMNYVSNNLKGKKKSYGRVEYGFRKSEKVKIVNSDIIPKEFMKTETTSEPMKTEIKKVLKDGKRVPGCVLETNLNLNVK